MIYAFNTNVKSTDMKTQLLSVLLPGFFLVTSVLSAQVTDSSAWWAWMHGSSNPGIIHYGVYGSKGTPDPANTPGQRTYPGIWRDSAGNFWMFGGTNATTVPSGPSNSAVNDMWHYNIADNVWTWVSGTNAANQNGIYGTRYTPSQGNWPGGRGMPVSWTDTAGNFWLFGGQGAYGESNPVAGMLNDLWKYNPGTNEWAWMHGFKTPNERGIYGTQGASHPDNTPGARNAAVAWVDSENNLWMFGGSGYPETGSNGLLSDLWKYNTTTNEWTWVDGPKTIGKAGVYTGTAWPGARQAMGGWKDDAGDFWMFGGTGTGATTGVSGPLNDLWKYDMGSGQWAHIHGGTQPNLQGVYGTMGEPQPGNVPGGRYFCGYWKDINGNFWVLGGSVYMGSATLARANDLWQYNPVTGEWTWMKGSRTSVSTGNWGAREVPAPDNTPSGRQVMAHWTDTAGNFWIFGGNAPQSGSGNGYQNDLWKLAPVCTTPLQPDAFTTSAAVVCQAQSGVVYTVPAVSGLTYHWTYTGTGVVISGSGNSITVDFDAGATDGDLQVRAVNNCDTSAPRSIAITVGAAPGQPDPFTVASDTVCQGESNIVYTVPNLPGAAYIWSYSGTGVTVNGSGNSIDLDFSNSATGGTLTVQAASNCDTSMGRSIDITVKELPVQPGAFTASSATVCQGATQVAYSVAHDPDVTYAWSYTGGSGVTINGSGSSITADFNQTATDGMINVTAENTCAISAPLTMSVTVGQLPSVIVSPSGSIYLCRDDTVTLTAGAGSGYSYEWKDDQGSVGSGGTYAVYATGHYRVVVTTADNCTDSTAPVAVIVYDRPQVALTPQDTSFCEGSVVILQVMTADTGFNYRWKNGTTTVPSATADFLSVNASGVYSVVAERTNIPGCTDSSAPATVSVYPLPQPGITWDSVLLRTEAGYASYQWYAGIQPVPGATDHTFEPSERGNYSVTVTDSNGCSNTSPAYNVTRVSITSVSLPAGSIKVYPNPAKDILHVDAPVPVHITLSNLEGKVLLRRETAGDIRLHDYAEGVYLLRISDSAGQHIKTEKVVIMDRK